jgi:hypothetical protein
MENQASNNLFLETPEEKLKRFFREHYDYIQLGLQINYLQFVDKK